MGGRARRRASYFHVGHLEKMVVSAIIELQPLIIHHSKGEAFKALDVTAEDIQGKFSAMFPPSVYNGQGRQEEAKA